MRRLLALLVALLVVACAPIPPASGDTTLADRPAELALKTGIRAYDNGQYIEAERQLRLANQAGLVSPTDRARAHKYLAFIYCTSDRVPQCENSFRAAKLADPEFALSKSEAGHPVWGPVYLRAMK